VLAGDGTNVKLTNNRREDMAGYIAIQDLHKSFPTREGRLDVLKGISFSVAKGDIFGIIGISGAGKSTLARCVNRLETPDSGSIAVGGVDMLRLSKRELAEQRHRIGMIFQTFNLFEAKTVYQNIAYPLVIRHVKPHEIDARVKEIAEVVGLQDKLKAYPAGLSGGQKQRVGIARALANRPDVLLSDEATSALDPQTTLSILELLKDINQQLGLTILLITHELDVIRYTCNNMAVLEHGVISESGAVRDIFANPNSTTGQMFLKVYAELQDSTVEEGSGI
jgi:D-methionine transport system ATP-binding protein